MKLRLSSMKTLIARERTLVIACNELHLGLKNPEMFLYTAPGNVLHPHDFRQQDRLQYYVEEKGCAQIIVCGHRHCHVLDTLMSNPISQRLSDSMKFNLKATLGPGHSDFVPTTGYHQALVELNVIQQCTTLMTYAFIEQRVESGELRLIGMVSESPQKVKPIYWNGFTFNHLISQN